METRSDCTPYAAFGQKLAASRVAAGIKLQRDLADMLSSTQQTISRWEAGLSRPRPGQIAAIAAAVNADPDDLMKAAGYVSKRAIVSFDQPFPVDGLGPENFERFAHQFLTYLYPDAHVVRYGGPGHKQDGLDILVTNADGTRMTFQCKRETEFGPQKVHTAVATHTLEANNKVILLSRTASPLARMAIDKHASWQLWDREDISLRVRELPIDAQRRLVRTFFRGQERALLGEDVASPWDTTDEFFAAFDDEGLLFNHEWHLVGRESVLDDLAKALGDASKRTIFLTGAGGSGKSRVLRKSIESYHGDNPAMTVRWISRDGEITKQSLRDLGDRPTLLIVDDAHDRNDLQTLFESLATNGKLRAVLAFRPYGLEHIRAQASGFSISGRKVSVLELEPLSLAATEELARQVLTARSGPLTAAKRIAELTADCPLATVIGAQIVATEGVKADLVQNEDRFRTTLFGRFEHVFAGRLGEPADAVPVRKLLRFLALVQPVHVEDDAVFQPFATAEGIALHEVKRLQRLLVQAGVLFKRGARHRISPDVLGDFLIEDQCVGPGGGSTGYAEAIFDKLPDAAIENLLVNLARLDWRRSSATNDESPLLDGIWRKLEPQQDYRDPHIKAVQAVAYYQPKRALAFVEKMMREGRFLNQIADIARDAAYNGAYLEHALELLWELGRDDARALGQHTDHPIRIIKELAEPQPSKPFDYIEAALDFVLGLVDRPEAWTAAHSPLDLLEPFLTTEGHQTSSSGYTISFSPYFLTPSDVASFRNRAVETAIRLLTDQSVAKAVRAARLLGDALRYPMGMFGTATPAKLRGEWTKQFLLVLARIKEILSRESIDPTVQVEIGKSVSWLAGHGGRAVAKPAREIIDALSDSLELRVDRAFLDSYGMNDRLALSEGHEERWANFLNRIVVDLIQSYGDGEDLRLFIGERLERLAQIERSSTVDPYVLVEKILSVAPGFGNALVENAIADPNSSTERFCGMGLREIMRLDADNRGRRTIARMLATGRRELFAAIGVAYGQQLYTDGWINQFDHDALGQVLEANDEWPVLCAIRALRRIAQWNSSEAIRLIRRIRFTSTRIADETAALFEFDQALPVTLLSREDALSLLSRLEPLPTLEGYWINKLLSSISLHHPVECAAFLMRRVDAASADRTVKIRPVNHGPWRPNNPSDRLAFRKTIQGPQLMREVAGWMRDGIERKGLFSHYSRQLFATMFAPYDEGMVAFLESWLAQAHEPDIHLIAYILREADRRFVFKHTSFVVAFLERARQYGAQVHRMASSELYCSAIAGMRSGTVGKAFPQDVELKVAAETVLSSLPRYSAAYTLYEDLLRHADQEIQSTLKEAEDLEE